MASPTLAPESPGRKRLILRVLLGLLLLLLVAVLAGGLWLNWAISHALPQLDGQLSVHGLTATVTVIRDQHGVPHITAANLPDLFFAQGYVTAQDRLWQMDMARRNGAGDLSEILPPRLFGEAVLNHDKTQRILGLRTVAEQAAAGLTGDEKTYFEAYAAGVNAYIASHHDKLPPEFRLLGYEPRPWTTADTFLIGGQMVEELQSYSFQHEWQREYVTQKVGPKLAADLYPNTSWRDHPPTEVPPDFRENPALPPAPDEEARGLGLGPLARLLPAWLRNEIRDEIDQSMLVPGSNNWVISGAHTASGKPLLSNDMHLGHAVPGVWYETHLTGPGFDVAGVTFAGVPFIVVGHNQRIAWGFTNVGPSTSDLYIENFNARGEYQTPSGWQKPQIRHEVIKVRGGSDVALDVAVTRHGPIVSDIFPGEKRKLALKWTLYDPGVFQTPFFDIDRAQNWDEFKKAIARFGVPSQNAVYGDVDGHIGYLATGKVPIRPTPTPLPVNGADDAHEWTGYVPFEQMPSTYDPPSGIIATANGRITPDGYPYSLSNEWGGSERTQRIYHVLQSGTKFAPSDMLALETDVYSAFDQFLAQRLVYAVDHSPNASTRARVAADILRGWNGEVTADSAAPTIVTFSDTELRRALLEPKLGPGAGTRLQASGWKRYQWMMSNTWVENMLLQQPKEWLPANVSSYDALLAESLEKAITREGVPNDLAKWHWGEMIALDMSHPLFERIPYFKKYAGPGHSPQSGDGTTVKQVGNNFGPSERFTADFSNLDQSTLNIVTGESGNVYSPYFMDHWPAWYHGTTFVLPFSPESVNKAQAHRLELRPQ